MYSRLANYLQCEPRFKLKSLSQTSKECLNKYLQTKSQCWYSFSTAQFVFPPVKPKKTSTHDYALQTNERALRVCMFENQNLFPSK